MEGRPTAGALPFRERQQRPLRVPRDGEDQRHKEKRWGRKNDKEV